MDRDFDGRLSFEEFMGEESPIEKLFKNMDKNGDGLVTKQVNTKVLETISKRGHNAKCECKIQTDKQKQKSIFDLSVFFYTF